MSEPLTGIIFDEKEFAVHDGPGVRTTVFFKGCPLRCVWCHNPEGLSPKIELMTKPSRCQHCGRCRIPCTHEACRGFDRCLYACPDVQVSVCGREVSVDELTEWLLKSADFLRKSGGVTFSGGEPLLQGEFLLAVCGRLKAEGIHLAVETCGYAPAALFDRMLDVVDYVMMDLKLMDPEQHKKYTGADNSLILTNAARLKASGKAHIFRTPLIPGITETPENRAAVLAFAGESPHEILPYNSMAGAKYPMLGIPFAYETSATGE